MALLITDLSPKRPSPKRRRRNGIAKLFHSDKASSIDWICSLARRGCFLSSC